MTEAARAFRGFRFSAKIIGGDALVPAVSGQLRDLKRMRADRGVAVDHTTIRPAPA
jgi:transposase-like protein